MAILLLLHVASLNAASRGQGRLHLTQCHAIIPLMPDSTVKAGRRGLKTSFRNRHRRENRSSPESVLERTECKVRGRRPLLQVRSQRAVEALHAKWPKCRVPPRVEGHPAASGQFSKHRTRHGRKHVDIDRCVCLAATDLWQIDGRKGAELVQPVGGRIELLLLVRNLD